MATWLCIFIYLFIYLVFRTFAFIGQFHKKERNRKQGKSAAMPCMKGPWPEWNWWHWCFMAHAVTIQLSVRKCTLVKFKHKKYMVHFRKRSVTFGFISDAHLTFFGEDVCLTHHSNLTSTPLWGFLTVSLTLMGLHWNYFKAKCASYTGTKVYHLHLDETSRGMTKWRYLMAWEWEQDTLLQAVQKLN